MKRREFIAGLGGAAAWPVVARAQQPAVPEIGYLSGRSARAEASMLAAFREGLNATGFVEGRNIKIETSPTASLIACQPWRLIWSADDLPSS
jgi:putative ABC transport system substrate-binding protein